jgi:hypothetical protein
LTNEQGILAQKTEQHVFRSSRIFVLKTGKWDISNGKPEVGLLYRHSRSLLAQRTNVARAKNDIWMKVLLSELIRYN